MDIKKLFHGSKKIILPPKCPHNFMIKCYNNSSRISPFLSLFFLHFFCVVLQIHGQWNGLRFSLLYTTRTYRTLLFFIYIENKMQAMDGCCTFKLYYNRDIDRKYHACGQNIFHNFCFIYLNKTSPGILLVL